MDGKGGTSEGVIFNVYDPTSAALKEQTGGSP